MRNPVPACIPHDFFRSPVGRSARRGGVARVPVAGNGRVGAGDRRAPVRGPRLQPGAAPAGRTAPDRGAPLGRRSRRRRAVRRGRSRATRRASSASTSRSPSSSPADSAARRTSSRSQFTSIDQSVARGDFDIGLSGIEDTPARRATLAVTVPVLRVPRGAHRPRRATATRFRTLADLRGQARRHARRHDRLRDPAARPRRTTASCAVSYDDDVHPYTDLVLGRVDAVLLDNVLADRRCGARRASFTPARRPSRSATTSASSARERGAARPDRRDPARRDARRHARARSSGSGSVWNDDQPALYARVLGEPACRPDGLGAAGAVAPAGRRRPSAACAPSCATCRRCCARRAHHDRALVPVDGAGRRCSAC